jgi:hypothetical protein
MQLLAAVQRKKKKSTLFSAHEYLSSVAVPAAAVTLEPTKPKLPNKSKKRKSVCCCK